MRCWRPTIDDALARIAADGVKRLFVLPLFPQYSLTTSGSCIRYFRATANKTALPGRTEILYAGAWYSEPLYLDAMIETIREAQQRFSSPSPEGIHLLYSSHSIPARYMAEGDPYQKQTEETVALINRRLEGRFSFTLAYQSKVGPVKWLVPSAPEVLAALGRRGADKVLVVPAGFVSDHIETLQEIDILYRDLATKAGIREFYRAPSLNTRLGFIEALAEICLKTLESC